MQEPNAGDRGAAVRGLASGGDEVARAQEDVNLLVATGAADPASPAAPALVDAWRRAGRPDEAERVAREALFRQPQSLAVRISLSLALFDLGKLGDARDELERALAAAPQHADAVAALAQGRASLATASSMPQEVSSARRYGVPPPVRAEALELLEEIEGDELDSAFAAAETEAEGLLDANDVAEEAIRAVEEGSAGHLLSAPESPFATATVAELLERQGHADDARAVRSTVAGRAEAPAREDGTEPEGAADARTHRHARVLATLERWLETLRRGTA